MKKKWLKKDFLNEGRFIVANFHEIIFEMCVHLKNLQEKWFLNGYLLVNCVIIVLIWNLQGLQNLRYDQCLIWRPCIFIYIFAMQINRNMWHLSVSFYFIDPFLNKTKIKKNILLIKKVFKVISLFDKFSRKSVTKIVQCWGALRRITCSIETIFNRFLLITFTIIYFFHSTNSWLFLPDYHSNLDTLYILVDEWSIEGVSHYNVMNDYLFIFTTLKEFCIFPKSSRRMYEPYLGKKLNEYMFKIIKSIKKIQIC